MDYFDPLIIKDPSYAESFSNKFAETFLSKKVLWIRETLKTPEIETKPNEEIVTSNEMEIDEFTTNVYSLNSENDKSGFAMLRGANWIFYIKKLYCIIGRQPIKNSMKGDGIEGNTSWLVDVDLGQNRKISKQHAVIIYNFETCSFEIRNISKKFPIKVNGEIINYNEEMPLTSKSLISIGNQEFYFFLPV